MRSILVGVFALVIAPAVGRTASVQGPPAQPVPGQPVPSQPTPGQTVTPPRAQPRPAVPEKGSGTIRGFVVSADDGSPVRRAEVSAFFTDGGRSHTAMSDSEGRFELSDLPAGRYTLSASKTGYQPPTPGASTAPRQVRVELAERQVQDKVQLLLTRGAVITGRVLDDLGDPAMGIEVHALRVSYRDGVRQLVPAQRIAFGPQQTDDRGMFRLYGLLPGDYFISARPRVAPVQSTGSSQGPALTFYPGTQDPAEARRVRAAAGQETGPIVFALGTTRLARVNGVAFGASGLPLAGGMVTLASREPFDGGSRSTGISTKADGSFSFPSVSPGSYLLIARDRTSGPEPPTEQGSVRLTITGDDLDGIAIFASQGAVLRGRVITDDGSPLPAALRNARVDSLPVDIDEPSVGSSAYAQVRDDGTFEMKGLFGRRRIELSRVQDWFTREVRAGGADVMDSGIEFAAGQTIEDADIVITRRYTTVSGVVTDADGQPVPRATIIVFSDDERRWTPRSRFVRMSMTGEPGRYRLTGAPPSDAYLIIALAGLEDGQWADPELLGAVKEHATRLRLSDGETKTMDLKVTAVR